MIRCLRTIRSQLNVLFWRFENVAVTRALEAGGMESESENVFGDELGLSQCFTAHSGTQGGHTGRAWRIRLAEKKRGTKRPGHAFRHVARPKTHRSETTTVGSLLRCVHTIQIKLRGRQGRQDLLRCASIRIGLGWLRPEGAQSAICALLTPFITYKHPLQHTNRLRCPSLL